MKQGELEALTQRYLVTSFDEIEDRLPLDWTPAGLDEYSSQLNEKCHGLSNALSEADMSSAIDLAREMAPQADELSQRKLARRLIEVRLDAAVAELRAIAGETLKRPEGTQRSLEVVRDVAKVSPKVSEVVALHVEERMSLGKWTAKTALQSQTIFQLIVDLLRDPPVAEVSKSQIRQLGLDMRKVPSNMVKKYPGLTVIEVLAKTDGDTKVALLGPRSVNKNYQHVRTLFKWAADHDYIAQSPATILREVEEGRAQDARKAFDDPDITALFSEIAKKAKEAQLT